MIDESILQRHTPNVRHIVRFLDSSHLRADLQPTAQLFEKLAADFLHRVPSSAATTTTLNRIVDAKDAAVRAQIHAQENNITHLNPVIGTVKEQK